MSRETPPKSGKTNEPKPANLAAEIERLAKAAKETGRLAGEARGMAKLFADIYTWSLERVFPKGFRDQRERRGEAQTQLQELLVRVQELELRKQATNAKKAETKAENEALEAARAAAAERKAQREEIAAFEAAQQKRILDDRERAVDLDERETKRKGEEISQRARELAQRETYHNLVMKERIDHLVLDALAFHRDEVIVGIASPAEKVMEATRFLATTISTEITDRIIEANLATPRIGPPPAETTGKAA